MKGDEAMAVGSYGPIETGETETRIKLPVHSLSTQTKPIKVEFIYLPRSLMK